jgi:hypothetical protein
MKRTERARQWEQHLSDWSSSGLTQRAYCERELIAYESFRRWRKQFLGQRNATATKVQFIAVQVGKSAAAGEGAVPPPARNALPWSECGVQIRLSNGRSIKLDARMDEHQLGRLIRLLEALPC